MSQLTLNSDPLGSATTGTLEFTTPAFYLTPATSQRGAVLVDQYIIQQATYTLTSQTAAQKLFSTTNGAVTLVTGTYEFDCVFSLSSMSASSGAFGFAFGGGATFTQYWWATAVKPTSLSTVTTANAVTSYNTTANTAISGTANTNTLGFARVGGLLVVTAGGTVIPQVSLGVAAAAVVGIGSYFKIRALGDSAATTSGNWS